MRRVGGAILAILLLVGVVAAVGVGTNWFGLVNQTVAVRGVIGSEKRPFFEDPRVQEIFADNGYEVSIETAGSREIATEPLAEFGFAFPSSAPAAVKINQDGPEVIGTYDPFYSPMIIASFTDIVGLLETAGVVSQRDGAYYFDMTAYLQLVEAGTRWNELEGNLDRKAYPTDRQILITSTDIRTSNSAAMYLSIASYVAAGGNVVTTSAQVDEVLPTLRSIFLEQGFAEASSEGPFQDYLTLGIGKAPIVMAYESQFLDRQMRDPSPITDDMVLMYPSPTVQSQHTLLSFTPEGDAVGQLISTDPQLQRLLAEYGFRIPDRAVFEEVLTERGAPVPPVIADTVGTPSYEVLEQLITQLSDLYTAAPLIDGDAAGATPDPQS